ncbi:haloacid dehalogenase-like hydrolase domain-containing 5 isoform X1 [Schistocerca nitens]|uniref:haloacid dehalogenase-like hydrolase domain-containing 5 isoform X1 n=1 Tax=Schistocerca nitens TaxID=7011 RepID=UPI0021183822|nr:haloacid dehalogenase-like hydrolase domain-containing 5 isoform X1 [Schistocerca nitens]
MKFLRNLSRVLPGSDSKKPKFGIICDIDGVITRGRNVLPAAKAAFNKLCDERKKLKVPIVFVTNAGNCLKSTKAGHLTNWLELNVSESQVVMSHSPLKLFTEFHNKRVLLSGQGPISDIALNLGFSNFVSIDEVRTTYPLLDVVDLERRKFSQLGKSMKPIDAIVLLGEPVRWETSLQLIIDGLLSKGYAEMPPSAVQYPHIPILACNMDLQWMAEASMPRFGHGAFLTCLEALYKKISGMDIIYSALVGKPSEITYYYSNNILISLAADLTTYPQRLYGIGDNIFTDVYGANLYEKYLHEKPGAHSSPSARVLDTIIKQEFTETQKLPESCCSILVETGVYSRKEDQKEHSNLDHNPRDFQPTHEDLKPKYIVKDVLEAVELIFELEKFH